MSTRDRLGNALAWLALAAIVAALCFLGRPVPRHAAKGCVEGAELDVRLRDLGPKLHEQLAGPGVEPPVVTGP